MFPVTGEADCAAASIGAKSAAATDNVRMDLRIEMSPLKLGNK
jgi:hypothetical protein